MLTSVRCACSSSSSAWKRGFGSFCYYGMKNWPVASKRGNEALERKPVTIRTPLWCRFSVDNTSSSGYFCILFSSVIWDKCKSHVPQTGDEAHEFRLHFEIVVCSKVCESTCHCILKFAQNSAVMLKGGTSASPQLGLDKLIVNSSARTHAFKRDSSWDEVSADCSTEPKPIVLHRDLSPRFALWISPLGDLYSGGVLGRDLKCGPNVTILSSLDFARNGHHTKLMSRKNILTEKIASVGLCSWSMRSLSSSLGIIASSTLELATHLWTNVCS